MGSEPQIVDRQKSEEIVYTNDVAALTKELGFARAGSAAAIEIQRRLDLAISKLAAVQALLAARDVDVGGDALATVSGTYIGTAPHDTFEILFDNQVEFGLLGAIAGWAFIEQVATDLIVLTGVIQPDGRTVQYTTTDPIDSAAQLIATYTAASGSYAKINGAVLADVAVDFGIVP